MTGDIARPASRLTLVMVVAVVAISGSGVAFAQEGGPPEPPHRVHGHLTDGGDAVAGETVEAVYDGAVVASTQTDAEGYYDLRIDDPSSAASDETLTIRRQGSDGGESLTWSSGASTELALPSSDDGSGDDGDGGTGDGGGSGGTGGGAGTGGSGSSGAGGSGAPDSDGDRGETTDTAGDDGDAGSGGSTTETPSSGDEPAPSDEPTEAQPDDEPESGGFDPVTTGGIVVVLALLLAGGYYITARR